MGLFLCSFAHGQSGRAGSTQFPPEVITPDSISWTISTLSTMGYVNTTPGANYGTYQGGGGMIVKFRFKEGGRYEFMLYVKVNTYGYISETWTQLEGKVRFTKDAKGQNIFITIPEKGVYRINKNGEQTSRPIPANELKNQHSRRFLWEKTDLKDDPRNTYLLMVDLKEHPGADVNNPQTIDPSWVSKFHIPKG
jgi:hypothetical protein